MMKRFGPAVGAPYESDALHVPAPIGMLCRRCGEPIAEGESGVIPSGVLRWEDPMHYECFLRGIVGGLNHQLGRCHCCGGDQPPDPEGMTRREAAIKAVEAWEQRGRFQAE
jgi:hypothetical protein